jgi:hypothetical protein
MLGTKIRSRSTDSRIYKDTTAIDIEEDLLTADTWAGASFGF